MRKLFRIIIRLFFGLILFSFILVFLYKWIPVKITPLMIIRSIENYQDGYGITIKHNWKNSKKTKLRPNGHNNSNSKIQQITQTLLPLIKRSGNACGLSHNLY